jgi:hypothetical protein
VQELFIAHCVLLGTMLQIQVCQKSASGQFPFARLVIFTVVFSVYILRGKTIILVLNYIVENFTMLTTEKKVCFGVKNLNIYEQGLLIALLAQRGTTRLDKVIFCVFGSLESCM